MLNGEGRPEAGNLQRAVLTDSRVRIALPDEIAVLVALSALADALVNELESVGRLTASG